jgi:RimJ/RimL family protein N-acetyltransferase
LGEIASTLALAGLYGLSTMRSSRDWPAVTRIDTRRLVLEPLQVAHAEEMVSVLGDAALYEYTGGAPPTLDELRARYARQVSGGSPDRTQGWLNWIAREREQLTAVGTVQANLVPEEEDVVAEVAWVIGVPYQRRGYAIEAAKAMVAWLGRHDVIVVAARVNPRHAASIAVATRLGLTATCTILDGETRWTGRRP